MERNRAIVVGLGRDQPVQSLLGELAQGAPLGVVGGPKQVPQEAEGSVRS